jgi:Fe-S-cluster containining protein
LTGFVAPITDRITAAGVDSAPFMQKLRDLYETIDQAYNAAAVRFGFECRGCGENCCRTLFYHHTIVETLFLVEGVSALDETTRSGVYKRAAQTDSSHKRFGAENLPYDYWCPLNINDRCLVYAHRPMICRLHGLPHVLAPPDRKPQTIRPGCPAFYRQCKNPAAPPLNRTPLYTEMAALEQAFRRRAGIGDKWKKTIAQMLVTS